MLIDPLTFSARGLHFREWRDGDSGELSRLFDTEQMNRWTPLPFPFSPTVAARYIAQAHAARRRDGTLHLAICVKEDDPPLGEVIVFPSEEPGTVELAYAVGADCQRQKAAVRAVASALDLAVLAGNVRAVLRISTDNDPSRATAAAAGFVLTGQPLRRRERKGFVLQLQTWERSLL